MASGKKIFVVFFTLKKSHLIAAPWRPAAILFCAAVIVAPLLTSFYLTLRRFLLFPSCVAMRATLKKLCTSPRAAIDQIET
jgi:hypothetical protein